MSLARQLVDSFARIAGSDGGVIGILSEVGNDIRLGYTPGVDEACESGACVLPHLELQEMMREWLSRRAPGATVIVKLVNKADAAAAPQGSLGDE